MQARGPWLTKEPDFLPELKVERRLREQPSTLEATSIQAANADKQIGAKRDSSTIQLNPGIIR